MQEIKDLHLEILDENRQKVLPLLKNFKGKFYLAGGTALALQIGHRDSIDFDFFTENDFNTDDLRAFIEGVFVGHKINFFQIEKNTVSCFINNQVKLSFFAYKSFMLNQFIDTEFFDLASLEDIFCMKLSAICGRSVNKDYVDIYFLLKKFVLSDILKKVEIKFPTINISVILKSLVYFSEMEYEPIKMMPGYEIDIKLIQKFLEGEVRNLSF